MRQQGNRAWRRGAIALAALALAASAAWAGLAATLVSSTVDGGGGVLTAVTAANDVYALVGTAGQADAGALSGGGFKLQGGFAQTDDILPHAAIEGPWWQY